MMLNSNQKMILCALRSADRALTAKEICQRTGVDARQLREEVRDMRMQGIPIISGNFGYAIASDKRQMLKCIRRIKAQVKDMNATISAMYGSMEGLNDDTVSD